MAAVLLHFVPITQTQPSLCKLGQRFLGDVSSLAPIFFFPQLLLGTCLLCVLSLSNVEPVAQNLFYVGLFVNCFPAWKWKIKKHV
jgi:hypothetical protein